MRRVLRPYLLYIPDRGVTGNGIWDPFIPAGTSSGFPCFSSTFLWAWNSAKAIKAFSSQLSLGGGGVICQYIFSWIRQHHLWTWKYTFLWWNIGWWSTVELRVCSYQKCKSKQQTESLPTAHSQQHIPSRVAQPSTVNWNLFAREFFCEVLQMSEIATKFTGYIVIIVMMKFSKHFSMNLKKFSIEVSWHFRKYLSVQNNSSLQ